MKILVQSLARLYNKREITEEKIRTMAEEGKITVEEYEAIKAGFEANKTYTLDEAAAIIAQEVSA